MIWMTSTQSNDKYTYQNEAEGDSTDRRGRDNVTLEADIGVIRTQTKEGSQPRDFPLQPSQGVQHC